MAKLVTLAEDGPLGPAGSQVWVDDDASEAKAGEPDASEVSPKPRRRKH